MTWVARVKPGWAAGASPASQRATAQSEQAARLEAAIRENQAQFSTAQEENRRVFSTLVNESRERLTSHTAEVQSDHETRIGALDASAKRTLKRMEDLEKQATRSFQATGTASVAGHFQTEANRQKNAANRWRTVAVATLFVFALAAAGELIFGDPTPSLKHSAARVPIALTVAAIAAIAFCEANQHRESERRLRQREVDLSSLDPILANVKDRKAAEALKLEHARHIFLEHPDLPNSGSGDPA